MAASNVFDKETHPTDKEVELQHSPSRWSIRYSNPDDVIRSHVDFVSSESKSVRASIPFVTLKYGPSKLEKVDLFGFGSTDTPVMVYIHGGYWQELNGDISAYCVKPIVSAGFRVAVVDYDLAPDVTVGEIIQQTKKAVAVLGSVSVVIVGHSAGAHLCAAILRDAPSNVKGAVLVSGVYDLRPIVSTYINDALQMTKETATELSPLLWDITSSPKSIPTLIVAAEHDSPGFIRQSTVYYEFLQRNGHSKVELKVLDNVDHFNIVEQLSENTFYLTKTIVEYLNHAQKNK